jgi:hypothetical protein
MKVINRAIASLLLLGCCALLCATASRAPKSRAYQDNEAYRVYQAVLPKVEAMRTLSRPLIQLETQSLEPMTDCSPSGQWNELLSPALKDYRSVNQHVWRLQPKLTLDRSYELVPATDLLQFYLKSNHLVVSAVGFNRQRTTAVVYIADRTSGRFYALRKPRGVWELADWNGGECGWIS